MSFSVGTPRCFVDIYPYEGGKYSLGNNAAGVLSCSVSKSVRDTNPGSFMIELAPGGPSGPNGGPQWRDLITPMSLVVIGMNRGDLRQIVMVGIVIDVQEPQEYSAGQPVTRELSVRGLDFQYFFTQRNFYALLYLASGGGAALGPLGLPTVISDGLLHGPPDVIAASWYNTIMAGPDGILADTQFSYRGGKLTFPDAMATFFESYPTYNNAKIGVPFSEYYAAEESWMSKFLKCFPYPWYECFVITAPLQYYPDNTFANPGWQASDAVTAIQMDGFEPVCPTLVGRVNPLPWSENYGLDVQKPDLRINYERWNRLTDYYPAYRATIAQDIHFDDVEIRNYYILNPTFAPLPFGSTNVQLAPFVYTYASWADPDSVQRYGFRPQISELPWFADAHGLQAQQNASEGVTAAQMESLVANVALRQSSYFQPTGLMARGSVVIVLNPEMMPGNRFTFIPFKDGVFWTFYIDAVSHRYRFGGSSVTTVALSRGLPTAMYAQPDLLLAAHLGRAIRRDGVYQISNAKGLQPFNQTSMTGLYGQITARVFQSPQAP